MKVILACLADHASIDQAGKISIHGVFDSIFAPKVPVTHGVMFLVVRVRLDFEDNRKPHELLIQLTDPDGKKLAEVKAEVAHEPIPAGQSVVANQLMGLQMTTFPKYGRYRWTLQSDNENPVIVYLDIIKPPTPPA